MSKEKKALFWIIGILDEHRVPYEVQGGLAARCYGSTRELVDIDIFIPSSGFEKIAESVIKHSVSGPCYHVGSNWRLNYQILNYDGMQIEICDAGKAEYLDNNTNEWIKMEIDFNRTKTISYLDIPLKVIPKADLIVYKSRLAREVDLCDIAQIC